MFFFEIILSIYLANGVGGKEKMFCAICGKQINIAKCTKEIYDHNFNAAACCIAYLI
jgi:hypothetical protein